MARKQVHTWRRGDFGRRRRAHVGGRLAPHVTLLSPLPYMRVLASHLRTARVSDAQLQSSLSNIAAAHLSAVHHKGDVGGSTRIATAATHEQRHTTTTSNNNRSRNRKNSPGRDAPPRRMGPASARTTVGAAQPASSGSQRREPLGLSESSRPSHHKTESVGRKHTAVLNECAPLAPRANPSSGRSAHPPHHYHHAPPAPDLSSRAPAPARTAAAGGCPRRSNASARAPAAWSAPRHRPAVAAAARSRSACARRSSPHCATTSASVAQ